jgi:biotin carboxyl carrier protein
MNMTSDIQTIDALASVLSSHNLTRLELSDSNLHIILEKAMDNTADYHCLPATTNKPALASGLTATTAQTLTPAHAQAQQQSPDAILESAISAASPLAPALENLETTDVNQPGNTVVVNAPLVGIAYRAAKPEDAAFVQIGSPVSAGATLCLIEAMKMFNEVVAPAAGTVLAIHFEDATLVEHGAPLFTLLTAKETA